MVLPAIRNKHPIKDAVPQRRLIISWHCHHRLGPVLSVVSSFDDVSIGSLAYGG
jgi:hypothetical protein